MLRILWYIIVGFIVGLIARFLVPGADSMGFLWTSVIGIVGSIVGGFIAQLFNKPPPGAKFHTAGFIMSIVGAIILLLVLRYTGIHL